MSLESVLDKTDLRVESRKIAREDYLADIQHSEEAAVSVLKSIDGEVAIAGLDFVRASAVLTRISCSCARNETTQLAILDAYIDLARYAIMRADTSQKLTDGHSLDCLTTTLDSSTGGCHAQDSITSSLATLTTAFNQSLEDLKDLVQESYETYTLSFRRLQNIT